MTVIDDHRDTVARRQASATRLVHHDEAVARIADAPAGYLLAHSGPDIARHAGLLSPLPSTGAVRVIATPGRTAATWHLDIATRDRPGVLAAFTGVLAEARIDVVQAVLATWDDGAALEAFVIRSAEPPDRHDLQPRLEASLKRPLASDPVDDARLCFDDDASPLYTRLDVRAGDRPGLLHAIAVAIASAGADVHAAKVTTAGTHAHDVFDLTDRTGHKLDPTLQQSIARTLHAGV